MLIPRTFSEMIQYFKDQVSVMNIPMKYRVDLLGMISAVETRHEQDMPKWIPCSERLPEYGKTVLITNAKGNVSYGRFRGVEFWKEDGDSCWTWKKNTIEHVLAWMPLPKPWEGDANGKER